MRRKAIRSGLVRKQRYQRYAIKQWTDRLADIPAFIIGNGYSINEIDKSILEPYFTIGINRAFKVIDPTILMWQDISLWNTEYQHLHNLQSLKVARDVADPRRIYYNFHLKSGPYKFTNRTHILYGRGSSGPIAVELAYAMGCRPIIILGMDCKLGPSGESDFYGDNPHWYDHTLTNCGIGLEFLRDNCPVEIISCSNNDAWKRHTLEEAIKIVDPQKRHARGRQSYVKQILRTE